MHRLLATPLVLLAAISAVSAQDLMPPNVMQQLGLTQAWARPVTAPAGAQSISNQALVVNQQNPREYIEIVMVPAEDAAGQQPAAPANGAASAANAPANGAAAAAKKVLARIATDQIQSNGQPIGRQEAERLANNEIRRLKRRGIEAEIRVQAVPRVHLFSIIADGTLECRDAETGEPIWMVQLGNPQLPFMALGANEEFLTVINGANLLQVDASNGEVIVEQSMPGAPAYGATNAGDYAMIPMVGGGLQCYPLRDPTIDPFLGRVEGAALTLPVKSPTSSRTAWATDGGFLFVMEMQGTPSLLFRLRTDGIVSGRPAAISGDRFYFGSESGQVYGVRATRSGQVLWSQPIGEPFYNEPTVFDDQVLIRSAYGNLYSLHVDDGHLTWQRSIPSIGDLIGVLGGRLYATTLSGIFTVIDLESGQRIATYPELRPTGFLVNTMTDRLYLISSNGDMQCLRLEDAELPSFNQNPDAQPVDEEEKTQEKPNATETSPFGPSGTDPFGAGGQDPFGAGGADPFGAGGADPFGGGAEAPMEDPFGGNPFGGN